MESVGFIPSAERNSVAKPLIDFGRKERVRQAVRRHLRTPALEPKTLARLVGMSRSNLYRLFEDIGGVVRYIQRERLLEAHAILSDPEKAQSISAISEDLCFADASSFSRTFKREYRGSFRLPNGRFGSICPVCRAFAECPLFARSSCY
jgi:AraC-like DNA-binding protein